MRPVPDGGGFDLDALLAPFKPGAKDLTGQTLSGCVVEKLLGRGAMGEVWLARRASDGAPAVVKRIDPVLASDPMLRARLQREWSSLAWPAGGSCRSRPRGWRATWRWGWPPCTARGSSTAT
jgi:hypothetical protein